MSEAFEGWAILELMGHRRLAGYVSEQEVAGAAFLRIDVPSAHPDQPAVTQLYSAAAVYCITPTTEEIARDVARLSRPEPVHRWELPPPRAAVDAAPWEEDDEEELDAAELERDLEDGS